MSGDGSQGAPLATLQEAIEQAEPQSTIALHAGSYAYSGVIDKPLTIVGAGACPNGTEITARFNVQSATVALSHARVTANDQSASALSIQQGKLDLESLWLEGPPDPVEFDRYGLFAGERGRIDGRELLLSRWDRAVRGRLGAVDLARVVVRGGTAFRMIERTLLELRDIYVEDAVVGLASVSEVGAVIGTLERVVFSASTVAVRLYGGSVNIKDGIFHQSAEADDPNNDAATVMAANEDVELNIDGAYISGILHNRVRAAAGAWLSLKNGMLTAQGSARYRTWAAAAFASDQGRLSASGREDRALRRTHGLEQRRKDRARAR